MTTRNIILGIHDGHTATATVLIDGEIISSISEERLIQKKNYTGFPSNAIRKTLQIANVSPDEITSICIASLSVPTGQSEMVCESRPYRKLFTYSTNIIPHTILGSNAFIKPYQTVMHMFRNKTEIISKLNEIGINNVPVNYIEHHQSHMATAWYPSGIDEPYLIITNDGSGDGICATVNIVKQGESTRIFELPTIHSIGDFYTRITRYLGMKSLEHEYKVMGLAPYAPIDHAEKIYKEKVSKWFSVDGMHIVNNTNKWGEAYLPFFEKELRGVRFDIVAYCAQKLVEDVITTWIKNIIDITKINNISCAGGVFMNVKLNMLLHEIPEINNLFVFPSGGDESVSIGATIYEYCNKYNKTAKPLKTLYLGSEYSNEEIKHILDTNKIPCEYVDSIEKHAAELLASDNILARYSGRAEWGARALGNRSILANPHNINTVRKLNIAIKKRDFWMPFTPTILFERASDYIINPKGISSPYMAMAFRTTPEAQKSICAALHPYDLTARPQILKHEDNPRYYQLIKEFETITGIGAVLNTSFNLHGNPIVETPMDAINTLMNSDIDWLMLGNYMVENNF